MSVLANQTNATPGDAFFWRVNASTITAKTFSSDRVLTDTLSTGSLSVGSISTTGSIVVSGDITAQNVNVVDTLESYFANFEYVATQQGANIGGLLIASNIAGYNTIFYPQAVISTISTSHIILDGNTLDTGGTGLGATLLLNGIPVVTTSTSISSLVQWAVYPAVSTVILDNNNITEVNNIQTQTFNAFDGDIANQLTIGQTLFGNQAEFQQVITDTIDSQNLVSLTGSISSLTVSTLNTNSILSPTGNFTNLTATNATINNLGATNINVVAGTITDFQAQTANINQLNATNETVSGTLTVNEVRGVNGFINAEAANRIRIRVQGSSDVFSSPELDLEAGGGNRGIVKLIANPGFGGVQGEVTVTAKGGSAAGYATGGLLNLTAEKGTAVLGTLNTSRVGIAADSVTSYAGGPTPFAGLLGYNFIYGLLGVNIVAATPPTLPNVPGTVYLYGLNPLGFGSSGGVRVQNGMSIDYITPYPQGFIEPQYDLIIKGNPAGQMVTLSNVRVVSGSNALLTGFQDINTVNLSATNLNGTNIFGSNVTGSNVNTLLGNISTLNTQSGQISGLTVSSLNGASYPPFVPTLSTFNQVFTSSLQANTIITNTANITQITGVSTLNGYTVEQLISSVAPLVFFSTISSFQELFTSSLQANTISTNTINVTQLTGVSTLNGYTVEQLISSVSPLVFFSTVSSFQELFTSSLQANTISTNIVQALDITGLSTINGFSVSDFVSSIGPPPVTTSTFTQLFTSSLVSNNVSTQVINAASILLNGLALTPQTSTFGSLTADTFQANQISSGSVVASTFNGYTIQQLLNPQTQSSFQTLFASTATIFELFASTGTIFNASNLVLQVSSINGFNTSQFLSSTSIPPQTSTFSTITTDTLQANQISSGAVVASSFNGYTIQQLLNPVVQSSFQQFFTSSLQTNNLSTNTATIFSLSGVSTINGFTIADFVSSVSPQPPIPSTVLQFYTSSLAANVVTNYQTSNLNLVAPTVAITTGTLIENADNYNLTVTSNIDINSSNAISIYTTNTAPPVATDGIYILGQGDTSIGSQTNTNITAANNILVNAVATTGIQGQTVTVAAGNLLSQQANYVSLTGSNQILLTSPQELRASSSNLVMDVPSGQSLIYLNQDQGIQATTNKNFVVSALSNIALSSATLTINGAPYGSVVSSFTTLATNTLTNNTSPTLRLASQVTEISTGFGFTIESGEMLNYSRSLIDFFAIDGVAFSTPIVYSYAANTNIANALNAPQIFTSSIVGNTASNSLYFGSTIHTNTLRNNDSINFDLNLIAAYFQVSTLNTLIETFNFGVIAADQVNIDVGDTFIMSTTYATVAAGEDLVLQGNNTVEIISLTSNIIIKPGFDVGGTLILRGNLDLCNNTITNVSNINLTNINGSPYTPGGGGSAISTFQQLFTSSFVVNTINGVAYPPPDSNTISTFQQLFTSSILTTTGTFQDIYITGGSAGISAEGNLSINAIDALTVATANGGLSLVSLSNDIQLYPRVLNPTGTITARGNLNLSNNNISNVNSLTTTTISTTNLVVTASTITSNLVVFDTIFNPSLGEPLVIQAAESLQLIGQVGLVLGTASNDILLTAGILDPGNQNVTLAFCDLNLSNNSINNVDVLNAGNINTTNLYATSGNISSLTVSTINTYPVHKAFGSAWATTDPAALALLAGIVNYVDIPTREAFNFVPDVTGNVFSLEPENYPLNRGIYQLNARCTFSNGDSNLATVSSWIDTVPNVSTTGTAISRNIIQIEPGRIGTTYMVCQSLVDEFISVNCFTTSDNITLYYEPGDGSNTPPSYAMNLTAHQLYQYENAFEVYNWPPNPIPAGH